MATAFNSALFRTYDHTSASHMVWGNGHTPSTDPVRNGWRVKKSGRFGGLRVGGRRGEPGCFVVSDVDSEGIELDFYVACPEEASGKSGYLGTYHVDNIPGWGLSAIRILNSHALV